MRRCLSLLVLPVLGLAVANLPARAADTPNPASVPVPAHHPRESWEKRFTDANQANDGHLTLEEAKSGYELVAKHFDDIDADHKGYVTENDVRAWRVMKKAAHRLTQPAPSTNLKPRNAMQLTPMGSTAVSASADQTVAPTVHSE